MKLPNAAGAFIALRKVTHYLLAETHTAGRSKAIFFRQLGFNPHQPEELVRALLELAQEGSVTTVTENPYGTKYVVDGWLHTPLGRRAWVRTVWIIEHGEEIPRLVTPYPVAIRKRNVYDP